jgi:phage terminase large subunit
MLSEARVFRNWRVMAFETPIGVRFYFGADWGFSVDPTVLVRCFIGRFDENGEVVPDYMNGDTLFIDMERYQVGCEIDNTPALFKQIPGSQDWPMTADSARPETISYMQRNGFPRIQPSVKGQGSVEDGIEFMKNFDIVVHPRCPHTIDELSQYAYKIDKKTNEVLPVLEDKKNHVIDAVRYALESTRRSNYHLDSIG